MYELLDFLHRERAQLRSEASTLTSGPVRTPSTHRADQGAAASEISSQIGAQTNIMNPTRTMKPIIASRIVDSALRESGS